MFESIKHRFREFFYGGEKIRIPADALVLDVASGGKPYWRSNVLMDKFVFDNSERDANLVIDRDFVVGDVNKMPFKDKVFDFVIARHILEHLPHPELFIKELERVAKAGYIETPSSFSENLYGWPFHLWEVDVENNILMIKSKEKNENKQLKKLSKYFDHDKNLKKFSVNNRSMFYTSYYWKDKINFKIIREDMLEKTVESQNVDIGDSNLKEYAKGYKLKIRIKKFINKLRRKLSADNRSYNLFDLLSCVSCHGDIKVNDRNMLVCEKCGIEYNLKDNIPVML
jgi:SAM-dependent methyltransferase